MSMQNPARECLHQLYSKLPKWKQPKCPSGGECVNDQQCIWTKEYYLALKRNELPSHKKTQRNLKCLLPSERSQSEKTTCFMTPTTTWHSGKGKTAEIIKKWAAARGREVKGLGTDGRQGGKTNLCETPMTDACHKCLSKPTESATPTVNHNINYELWVILMCPQRFTAYKKASL